MSIRSNDTVASQNTLNTIMTQNIDSELDEVRNIIVSCLAQTSLKYLVNDYRHLLGNGKMLRARLAMRIGPTTLAPRNLRLYAAAAVEMIHAASLLHDDVIDGGVLRRGAPAFWVQRGVSGAILFGDLLLFKALDLLCKIGETRLTEALIQFTGEVCDAESEQELILRGQTSDWDRCLNIARRKTGSLFAFIAYACGGDDVRLSSALKEAGYTIGTAYQVADDILDVNGNIDSAGKTLGTDVARDKNTAATVALQSESEPIHKVEELYASSLRRLSSWPDVCNAWESYLTHDIRPALDKNLACYTQ